MLNEVMMLCRFGGKGSLNELINYNNVCRTAPDMLGLLKIRPLGVQTPPCPKKLALGGYQL